MINSKVKDEIIQFVLKRVSKEKDKWNSGMKNDYYAWEDAYYEIFNMLKEK